MTPETSHFDNPLTEQRKLLAGDAVIVWEQKSVVRVAGEKSKSWLHSLLSQNIVNLPASSSTEALLLDPQGRIQQIIQVSVVTEDELLLSVQSDHGADLLKWLRSMVFRSGVTVEDVTDRYEVVGAFAPIEEFEKAPHFVDTWPEPRLGGVRYGSWVQPFPYREYYLAKGSTIPERLSRAGQLAFDAIRIWAGRPLIQDTDERSLPHEFDLLASAVHLSKGCYRGQESVAKVHNLGHPPRRIVLLELDASETLPHSGDPVMEQASGREVGKILAAAQHFEAGPIALALVSRNTILDALLEVQTGDSRLTGRQQVLVPPSAGAAVDRPKLPKLHLGSKR